ncbi:MAG: tripartite tricarboxylate transporter permease [Bacillota bacterium]
MSNISVIVTLTVIGSYALGNNIYDVWTMLVFGILGYFMRNNSYHPAALVLGLILGPMAEKGFRQSLVLSNGNMVEYFFNRPISVILIILIVLTLVGPFLMEKRRKRKPASAG